MSPWQCVKWNEAGQIVRVLRWPSDKARDAGTPKECFDRLVAAGKLSDATWFLGQALPRFEAVAWAAREVRDILGGETPGSPNSRALRCALLWLQDPVDARRRAAYEAAQDARSGSPEHLAAMAVFYSGGSVAPVDCEPLPSPRDAAGRFASGAILVAAATSGDSDTALRTALRNGDDIAQTGARL